MKKTNITLITLVSLLILNFVFIPTTCSTETYDSSPKSSQILRNPVSIAIYDDANTTRPFYSSAAVLTNNYSEVQSALLAEGYDVTPITTNQIYNHELTTAQFDVFIMADHLPKANISNFVLEYWLGGGSLLSMDSAACFLGYYGIIPPESAGDDGWTTYWTYLYSSNQNITSRHPVSKSYQLNDTFTIDNSQSSATFDWVALQGSSIASELVKIATIPGSPDDATAIAFDPQSRGGKVVHLPSPRQIGDDPILIDAIEWLCPTPKGRIVFDLSHIPRLGVDNWDDMTAYPGRFEDYRDALVSRGYLFDKLYPSPTVNFSSSRLNPYDMLIIVSPDSDYSPIDRTAVTSWVNNGGGLLVMGDNPTASDFLITNGRINYLLNAFDLELNETVGFGGTFGLDLPIEHPSMEGCVDLSIPVSGAVNTSGSAYELWTLSPHSIICGQDAGSGKIVLSGDMNWCDDLNIASDDNNQFAINLANWLVSWEADILLYTDEPYSYNYYQTPVANALNELGHNFFITSGFDGRENLNLSLSLKQWDLVIVDNPWYTMNSYFDDLGNYLDDGGRLLMSTYTASSTPNHALFSRMGFEVSANILTHTPTIYIWDAFHEIFSEPIDYDLPHFTPFVDYGDEGDLLTVYANATAIAGYVSIPTADNAIIVLRNDFKTLYNGFLIDEFTGDEDDSTYPDNLELWICEIAFMWSQIPHDGATPSSIPGFDFFGILLTMFATISLVALVLVKKKKNL